MSKRLLVLGAGAAQLGLLEAAREHGLFTIAVDRDPSAPGFRFAGLAHFARYWWRRGRAGNG